MCYKSPGPRCSSHARKTLTSATKSYREKSQALNTASLALAQAEEKGKVTDKLLSTRREAFANFKDARVKHTRCLRDYVATPAGKEEYESKLNQARKTGDTTKVEQFDKTLKQAAIIRGWRQNALQVMKENGDVPVSKKQKFNSDGTLKLKEDGLGVVQDGSDVGGDVQIGDAHSRRFISVDNLSQVTQYAYTVGIGKSGSTVYSDETDKIDGYSYQVQTYYSSYDNALDRDQNQVPSFEDYRYMDDSRVYATEEEASSSAKEYMTNVDPAGIRWTGSTL